MDVSKTIADLSPLEKEVLTLYAIALTPITNEQAAEIVSIANLKMSNGKKITRQAFNQVRKDLLEKQLLVQPTTFGYYSHNNFVSNVFLREALLHDAVQSEQLKPLGEAVKNYFDRYSSMYFYGEHAVNKYLRQARIAVYLGNFEQIDSIEKEALKSFSIADVIAFTNIYATIFATPFRRPWFEKIPAALQKRVLPRMTEISILNGLDTRELEQYLDEQHADLEEHVLLMQLFRGALSRLSQLEIEKPEFVPQHLLGALSAMQGDYGAATLHFEAYAKQWRRSVNKKKGVPALLSYLFYPMALLGEKDGESIKKALETSMWQAKNHPEIESALAYVAAGAHFQLNAKQDALNLINGMPVRSNLDNVVWNIVASWIDPEDLYDELMPESLKMAQSFQNHWFQLEMAHYLSLTPHQQAAEYQKMAEKLAAETGIKPLGKLIPRIEKWERALNALSLVAKTTSDSRAKKTETGATRLVWQVNFESKHLQPLEQKLGKDGLWSGGRNVALKRLKDLSVDAMTEQDRAVAKAIKADHGWGHGSAQQYYIDWEKAMLALVDHPLLFLQKSPTTAVQLTRGEPNLVVKQKGNTVEIQFDRKLTQPGIQIVKETNTRYKLLEINTKHLQIAAAFEGEKLTVPAQGREMLSKIIDGLRGSVKVQSELEEHFENLPSVEPDPRIYALLLPVGEGFQLEFFVKPLQSAPPYLKPGKGSEMVSGEVDGQWVQTKRNLKAEHDLLQTVQVECPILLDLDGNKNLEWDVQDVESCLQLLVELETPRQNNRLVIEWPKGEKLRIAGRAGFDNLSVQIERKNDWFTVEGEVKVSEDLVLTMQELTKLLQAGQSTNFVQLSDGQYLALTDQFRKRLAELNSVLDDKMRFHPLAADLVEDFAENAGALKADKHWKQLLKKLREARAYEAQLPGTFQADLRPYQLEGFRWLSQLAHWGVGACLADDMGLGKTIQALAVLVDRAAQGPALVVAPVSVTRNWEKEAARFAPTLRFQIFGSGDRKMMVENLEPFDVLVTSYNLLQIESEAFENKHFATIILDEAQAIKNRATKRSKTVMNLRGDFKIITTGTPVENHLGELWNLFNFINPGLLGSIDRFNERFATPIEKYKDPEKRRQLQKIVKPFILRRRKNQVLDELPEKTEIQLTVELSPEERAFYEALRRDAVTRIESEAGDVQDKRFRILAELTKLRLASCHPKLAQPDVPLGSSKLELFLETVEELLENNHKALVFSQFVKHLEIVEAELKSRKIRYQYLDGSTPPQKRQERIDAFQRGEGDLFLISLKAGGVGLNLTAADYVIHLDPWWNPAVEDQATDRAHRIGQQRPVTVYRLVAEKTVEEKILKLHEHKRDLADSLLAGTDMSGKMSADELLALIREN